MIGPAGEKLVRFACIQNNRTHSLGRGGCGAVMGSKNVKGLVFHGSTKPEVARPDELKALVREMVANGKDHPSVRGLQRQGHGADGAPHQRRLDVPDPLLDQGAPRRLRAALGRDR